MGGTKAKSEPKHERKSFGKSDEVRTFRKGQVELIEVGGTTVGRAVLDPGWKRSTSAEPIASTQGSEALHFQYHVSGVLRVRMDDGSEFDCRPGDVSVLPSAHEAWVVGNEPVVLVDFQGMVDYAK